MKTLPSRAASIAGTEKGSKRFFIVAASAADSPGTTSLFQMSLVSALLGARIFRISGGKPSQGSRHPGIATRAAIRFSKAAARGARLPAMLSPVRTIRSASTSERATSQSTSGVTTVSQRGVKTTRFTKSNCPWPGPSYTRAFQSRSSAAATP
ncbi:hypothetical protein [Streptomyces sp. NBC_00378]|uniref:hypothetical protein n=1 Tax=unclassified Streptomyces TaxID=2593676 RepID=UPI00338ECCC6